MAESVTFKRNAPVRTCSVCNIVEIDKTTAYTKTGEQKPQGRRCIACVDEVKPKQQTASKAPAKKPSAVAKPTPVPEAPSAITSEHSSGSDNDAENSMTKYIIGAVIIVVIIWLVLK